jgi:hypothetical protein
MIFDWWAGPGILLAGHERTWYLGFVLQIEVADGEQGKRKGRVEGRSGGESGRGSRDHPTTSAFESNMPHEVCLRAAALQLLHFQTNQATEVSS